MYQPDLGRFMQNDPLSDVFPLTTVYGYALNNPIVFKDKDGAFPDPPTWLKRALSFFGMNPFEQPQDAQEAAQIVANRRALAKVAKDAEEIYDAYKSILTLAPGMSTVFESLEFSRGKTTAGDAIINVSFNTAVDFVGGKIASKALAIAGPLIRGVLEKAGNTIIRLGRETAESVMKSTSRLQHGFKHAKDIKQFNGKNWNKGVEKEWSDFNQGVLENADMTFMNTLGEDKVIGFYKNIDGQNVATYVYAEGDRAGQYASTVVLTENQMKKFGLDTINE